MASWDYIRIQLLYSFIKECRFSLLMLDNNELFLCVEELHDKTLCNSKNAVAMKECFKLVIHKHTQINVVWSVVYNCG